MKRLTQSICTVIPPHMLRHIAEHGDDRARTDASATIRQTLLMAEERERMFMEERRQRCPEGQKNRCVFDAGGGLILPGTLVLDECARVVPEDLRVLEAFNGLGAMYDLLAHNFGRNSIDGHGMRLDATVHYGQHYNNAMWNGRQLVFGDGDGKLFRPFTSCPEVIGHELGHGLIDHTARLPYSGEGGALNESIADCFGQMVLQGLLGQTAIEAGWTIGADLLGPEVRGTAIRSMKKPGTAYDDPVLGRDPQVGHMRDYVDTPEDNGGVHINSGIPNRAFYLFATALRGRTSSGAGWIWYRVLTRHLRSTATFSDFASATVAVAGELYGEGSDVQQCAADAWDAVGVPVRRLSPAAVPAVPPPRARWDPHHTKYPRRPGARGNRLNSKKGGQ